MNKRNVFWIACILMLSACDVFEKAPEKEAAESKLEMTATSNNRHFQVTVSTEAKNQPPIGQFHNWLLTIRDAQSRPVYPVVVSIGGGMPSHGHGLPTQPQVTEHLGDGVYRIEGVKFNMGGAWALNFSIATQQLQDSVQFDFNVNH